LDNVVPQGTGLGTLL